MDELLEREILKLLGSDAMHPGYIRNKLNGFPLGLDVSDDEVNAALHSLMRQAKSPGFGRSGAYKKDPEDFRQHRVRQLFVARYPGKPPANDVLAFFGWLEGHYPELLPKEKQGDPYQHLKSDLHGLYDEQT